VCFVTFAPVYASVVISIYNYINNSKKNLCKLDDSQYTNKSTKQMTLKSVKSNRSVYEINDKNGEKNRRDIYDTYNFGDRLYNQALELRQKHFDFVNKKMKEYSYSFRPEINNNTEKYINIRDSRNLRERISRSQINPLSKSFKQNNHSRNKNHRDIYDFDNVEPKYEQYNDTNNKNYSKKPKITQNLYKFKPTLDRNSLEIAGKLGISSFQRLTKPLSRSTNNLHDINIKNESKYKTSVNMLKKRNTSFKLGHSLYDRARRSLSNKKEKIKQKSQAEEKSHLKYPFKPKVNKRQSRSLDITKDKVENRLFNWEKKNRKNKEKLIKLINFNENKLHPFKPTLLENNLKDNDELIKRNLTHIYKHLKRQLKSVEKKKEKERIYKKKI